LRIVVHRQAVLRAVDLDELGLAAELANRVP
jgi:hypothetical protein